MKPWPTVQSHDNRTPPRTPSPDPTERALLLAIAHFSARRRTAVVCATPRLSGIPCVPRRCGVDREGRSSSGSGNRTCNWPCPADKSTPVDVSSTHERRRNLRPLQDDATPWALWDASSIAASSGGQQKRRHDDGSTPLPTPSGSRRYGLIVYARREFTSRETTHKDHRVMTPSRAHASTRRRSQHVGMWMMTRRLLRVRAEAKAPASQCDSCAAQLPYVNERTIPGDRTVVDEGDLLPRLRSRRRLTALKQVRADTDELAIETALERAEHRVLPAVPRDTRRGFCPCRKQHPCSPATQYVAP